MLGPHMGPSIFYILGVRISFTRRLLLLTRGNGGFTRQICLVTREVHNFTRHVHNFHIKTPVRELAK
jgi:hypothetical protein